MSHHAEIEVATNIAEILAERPGHRAVSTTAATTLESLDVDSMDVIVIVAHYEAAWDVELDLDELESAKLRTLGDLSAWLANRRPS